MEMNNTSFSGLQDSLPGGETERNKNGEIVYLSAVTFLVLVGFPGQQFDFSLSWVTGNSTEQVQPCTYPYLQFVTTLHFFPGHLHPVS